MIVGLDFILVQNDSEYAADSVSLGKLKRHGAISLVDQVNRTHGFSSHGVRFKIDDVG